MKNHITSILLHQHTILLHIPADWNEEPHHALEHVFDHARGRDYNEEEGDVRPSKLCVWVYVSVFLLGHARG